MKEIFSGMLGKGRDASNNGDAFANMIPMMIIGNMLSGGKDNELGNFSDMFDLDFDKDETEDKDDTAESSSNKDK